jgi:hypothetical protein
MSGGGAICEHNHRLGARGVGRAGGGHLSIKCEHTSSGARSKWEPPGDLALSPLVYSHVTPAAPKLHRYRARGCKIYIEVARSARKQTHKRTRLGNSKPTPSVHTMQPTRACVMLSHLYSSRTCFRLRISITSSRCCYVYFIYIAC